MMNRRRIINWITYTIVCALLPMMISLLVRNIIISTQEINTYNYSGELLLFSVMVAATSIGDIKDFQVVVGKDIYLDIFFSSMLVLLLVSSILYGCNVIADNVKLDLFDVNGSVFFFSRIISVIIGILGAIIQIVIARSEGE